MDIKWEKKIDSVARADYLVFVPAAEIRAISNKFLLDMSDNVVVPGFRKGKAPGKLILGHIEQNDLKKRIKDIVQNEAFAELIKQLNVKTVGPPAFMEGNLDLESDYTFEVDFAKDITAPKPTHERQIPVVGDLSGNPMAIHEKIFGESLKSGKVLEHLPDDVRSVMPETLAGKAKAMLSDAKDLPAKYASARPQPGNLQPVESFSKTLQPEDIVKAMPQEALDEKAKPPTGDLDEKLPDISSKPSTDIKAPEVEGLVSADQLDEKIKSPSQMIEHKDTAKPIPEDFTAEESK